MGKSTSLNIIGLLNRPDRGDMRINGVKSPDLHKKIYQLSGGEQQRGALSSRTVPIMKKAANVNKEKRDR